MVASVQPATAPVPTAAFDASESPDRPVIGAAISKSSRTEDDPKLPRRFAGQVLLVEDESPIRQTLRELLEGEGYRVLEAVNGVEALQILRRDRPDLIVLDLKLPRMSGWQFLEQSREELDRGDIRVAIVSAIAGGGHDPKGLGVAAWLTKRLIWTGS